MRAVARRARSGDAGRSRARSSRRSRSPGRARPARPPRPPAAIDESGRTWTRPRSRDRSAPSCRARFPSRHADAAVGGGAHRRAAAAPRGRRPSAAARSRRIGWKRSSENSGADLGELDRVAEEDPRHGLAGRARSSRRSRPSSSNSTAVWRCCRRRRARRRAPCPPAAPSCRPARCSRRSRGTRRPGLRPVSTSTSQPKMSARSAAIRAGTPAATVSSRRPAVDASRRCPFTSTKYGRSSSRAVMPSPACSVTRSVALVDLVADRLERACVPRSKRSVRPWRGRIFVRSKTSAAAAIHSRASVIPTPRAAGCSRACRPCGRGCARRRRPAPRPVRAVPAQRAAGTRLRGARAIARRHCAHASDLRPRRPSATCAPGAPAWRRARAPRFAAAHRFVVFASRILGASERPETARGRAAFLTRLRF